MHALSFLRTMTPGTTASLICPACGQAFLSMQQSMEGMVQCPHCAYNAQRGYFGTQAQVVGVAQVRRRVSQTQPLQSMPSPAPQQAHVVSQPAAWPGLQSLPEQAPAPLIARPTLQYSQALMPTGSPSPQTEEFTKPPHLRSTPWRGAFILLSFTVVCGGAAWLWWDSVNESAAKPDRVTSVPPARTVVPNAQIASPVQIARAIIPTPDLGAATADAKALVSAFFAADTAERRAACIHDAGKYSAEIEAQFGGAGGQKTELRLISPIPGMPQTLPGGAPVPLFKLVTSAGTHGALIRLETGADRKRRINWPLLFETHTSALANFLKQPTAEAAWFHVGLRPNHGLDIAAELRPKYITFDVQVSGSSDPHFVACVVRDTPLGRFMDRETEWGKAYLARLLVRKLDIRSEVPCLLVIDCEGAPER